MLTFNHVVQLLGRYPELRQDPGFITWSRAHGANTWHEQKDENGTTVVVQSIDGLHVFAAEVEPRPDADQPVAIRRSAHVDLLEVETLRDSALLEFNRSGIKVAGRSVHAIRPVAHFAADGGLRIEWEIEAVSRSKEVVTFRHGPGKDLRPMPRAEVAVPPAMDSLAHNDLHHVIEFSGDARTATGAAATVHDKARGIFDFVRLNYLYDATIYGISEFTWSDLLTRDTNGRRGICDEWSIVQISMLRAVGIPARLKFLVWLDGGNPAAHACLEYKEGTMWWHMDALWNAFHNPDVYRNGGAVNVTVMDADYPSDSRSTSPAWGVPDATGDGKLNPYADFVILPAYPGNSRPGYSY